MSERKIKIKKREIKKKKTSLHPAIMVAVSALVRITGRTLIVLS